MVSHIFVLSPSLYLQQEAGIYFRSVSYLQLIRERKYSPDTFEQAMRIFQTLHLNIM